MTAAHRDARIPWRIRLACRMYGHQLERLAARSWRCTRCERIAPTPVELP